jgi:hypothetical protein
MFGNPIYKERIGPFDYKNILVKSCNLHGLKPSLERLNINKKADFSKNVTPKVRQINVGGKPGMTVFKGFTDPHLNLSIDKKRRIKQKISTIVDNYISQ